jgi:putative endonuclease
MAEHNETGRRGEDLATAFLLSKGYGILERNWKSGHKEIDIIAQDGRDLVFVEVKTRTHEDVIPAIEAVDAKKRQRLISAADSYIRYCRLNLSPRFDIITVVGEAPNQTIEHIIDAFLPPVRSYR